MNEYMNHLEGGKGRGGCVEEGLDEADQKYLHLEKNILFLRVCFLIIIISFTD